MEKGPMQGKGDNKGSVLNDRHPFPIADIDTACQQKGEAAIPSHTRRVLFIDDEPAFLDITKIYLDREGDLEVITSCTATEAISILGVEQLDAVVADYQLPDINGIDLLKRIRSEGNEVPFIIFTGWRREEIAIEALNSGADFYLQKGGDPKSQFAELAHFIRRAAAQKEAERALLESEHRFRELVQLLPQVVFEADATGKLTFVNKFAFQMFGYTEEEFTRGVSLFQVIHEKDRERALQMIGNMQEGNAPKGEEFTAVRRNGSMFPFIVYATSIYREGTVTGLRGILIDITEQKMMQEVEKTAFEQIEKNINQLSILNDHIRNPLAVIVGLADMDNRETSRKILLQAQEINRIITELDMRWLESEKIREFMRKHYGVGEKAQL